MACGGASAELPEAVTSSREQRRLLRVGAETRVLPRPSELTPTITKADLVLES